MTTGGPAVLGPELGHVRPYVRRNRTRWFHRRCDPVRTLLAEVRRMGRSSRRSQGRLSSSERFVESRLGMLDAVIGLGSNLGDRRDYLVRAARRIAELGDIVRTSAIYETRPVGIPQPDFLNAALRVVTRSSPEELLERLLAVEESLGRVRRERWGPRVIDLDILWSPGIAVRSERLVVPHAELRTRPFA